MSPKKKSKSKEPVEPEVLNGTFVFPDGSVYEGEYITDTSGAITRVGKGKMKFVKDSSVYEGEWKDDQMHGQGKLSTENGNYEGDFENNAFNGHGTYSWNSGQSLTGSWKGNRLTESNDGCYVDSEKRNWLGAFDSTGGHALKPQIS